MSKVELMKMRFEVQKDIQMKKEEMREIHERKKKKPKQVGWSLEQYRHIIINEVRWTGIRRRVARIIDREKEEAIDCKG